MVGRQVRYPEYENWLEEIARHGGEYNWVMQKRDFPLCSGSGKETERSVAEIQRSVLKSRVVQETIETEALRRKCSKEEVYAEAKQMVTDMSHEYSLSVVRTFGYAVAKIFNKLFDGIYANKQQLKKIREISKSIPVVFMPTHRTYLDFLLVSLMCFEYEITLPAIAAGQDFQSMAVMGTVLQKCGAFFMRRSFGKDRLYWAVFSEYVQSHVVSGDRPVEFFVEGTRSRVGKSLHPKYGLMQIIIEPYLRGDVFDMAREVLNKRFGKCFMTFGEPISVRQHFGSHLLRNSFVTQPASQFQISYEAKEEIKKFAHQIVGVHRTMNVVTVWPLACLVMLQKLDQDDESSFRFSEIHRGVEQLIYLLNKFNITVHHTDGIEAELRYYIRLHDDLFRPMNTEDQDFHMRLLDLPVDKSGSVRREIMERAVSRLVLTTYSNLVVEAMIEAAYIAMIIDQLGPTSRQEIQKEFVFLQNILKREFVFVPGEESRHFEQAVKNLQKAEVVSVRLNGDLDVVKSDILGRLTKIALPYLCQVLVVLETVVQLKNDFTTVNGVVKASQNHIVRLYELGVGIPVRLSFLSTEPIKNSFNTLVDLKAITKQESGLGFNSSRLEELYRRLSKYTRTTGTVQMLSFSAISAKL